MTLDASTALPYGPLERTEVYFEHDGPKFFAARARDVGQVFLAFCTRDDDDSDETEFLYLALSESRFAEVRAGHIGLREAFELASPWQIWRVIEDYSSDEPEVHAEMVRLSNIDDADLPLATARLSLQTATAPEFESDELATLSSEGLRTMAAVELQATGENMTEFPLKGLGRVGTALQETIDALAQEVAGEPTERGPIPASVTNDVQMSALGLRAASFVLVIGTDKRGGFMDNAPAVEATLDKLVLLVGAGTEAGALVTAMREHGARARGKFTNLLRAVFAYESGIGVTTATQGGLVASATMTAAHVTRALATIETVAATVNYINVPRGTLLASNTRRRTFEVFDNASANRYSGAVSGEAQGQIDGLSVGNASFVRVRIREEVDFAAEDQETGRTYTLLDISPVEA